MSTTHWYSLGSYAEYQSNVNKILLCYCLREHTLKKIENDISHLEIWDTINIGNTHSINSSWTIYKIGQGFLLHLLEKTTLIDRKANSLCAYCWGTHWMTMASDFLRCRLSLYSRVPWPTAWGYVHKHICSSFCLLLRKSEHRFKIVFYL